MLLRAVCLLTAFSAMAQPPGGGRAVTAGHIHVNSADPDAAIAFWCDVMGTSTYSLGSLRGVSTLGVTILFTQQSPSGPSAGSAIDRLAFRVPDIRTYVDRLSKASPQTKPRNEGDSRLVFDAPDGVRIELVEDSSTYAPLEFSRIHVNSAQPKPMQQWYATHFGARTGIGDAADSILIQGATLALTQATSPVPTAGRAIDHLGFEVRDIQAFCNQLVENGVKLDSPPQVVPDLKASIAFLTDPWGTRIELMEKTAR
jgi:catechol 2,3-dioxygenase-like lactoylglutathione lyase family enzyme